MIDPHIPTTSSYKYRPTAVMSMHENQTERFGVGHVRVASVLHYMISGLASDSIRDLSGHNLD